MLAVLAAATKQGWLVFDSVRYLNAAVAYLISMTTCTSIFKEKK